MQAAAAKADPTHWFAAALWVVALVTGLRVLALFLTPIDLYTDEAQYWLWGQRLDFGYYSKPPLIGWVIRAVTELAGSDAPFWVRLPAPLLHGLTAMLLGAVGAKVAGARVGFWSAVIYVTLPFTAVGSVLISTDTIMAPAYAAAVLFLLRASKRGKTRDALLAGGFAGLAFLAKYAAIYLVIGAVLAALVSRHFRPGWRNAAVMVVAFAAVISGNVVWNLTHDLATVEHTMDNMGWLREEARKHWSTLFEFWGSQIAVFGPVTIVGLIMALRQMGNSALRGLWMLTLPPFVAVSVQAYMESAYANWAIATYFAGTILTVAALSERWRKIAFGVNGALSLAVLMLVVLAPWPEKAGAPLLKRYLGRADTSQVILDLAKAEGLAVYSGRRDVLADLFYTGRESGVAIFATRPSGRPGHYYEQNFALPEGYAGELLVIAANAPECDGAAVLPLADLRDAGVWQKQPLAAYRLAARCLE
ncbi:glycosyltransferase family 39 protein [Thioclava sp. A2]|uniref:ArnT family glycosyltransferase n=1 Tax=Thioclava sp. FCG-A2 TaxID=3080562 RepID=UPI00295541F0|nr:glycosyltransferase family 39 protein [Thioclava sp. A2]MDV7271115.1 glycosyltransferase family 39 protein [Thioclava sp. A2]